MNADIEELERRARDDEMRVLKKAASENRMVIRIGLLIVLGIALVASAIAIPCTIVSLRNAELRSECIAAEGVWVGGNCVL